MVLIIRALEDFNSVLQKLRSDSNEITLSMAPDWDLSEEISSFLKKQSH